MIPAIIPNTKSNGPYPFINSFVPEMNVATINCPKLCVIADKIETPVIEKGLCFQLIRKHITTVLRIPPLKLIKKAVITLVPAKSDFAIVIKIAYLQFKELAVNIVTIFESPNFAPGGRPGTAGIKFSINESTIERADKIPRSAIFSDFFIISP